MGSLEGRLPAQDATLVPFPVHGRKGSSSDIGGLGGGRAQRTEGPIPTARRSGRPGFGDDSADAAFIDADKAGYATYLERCTRIARPGGLILCDNAFAFGSLLDEDCDDESVQAIRAFNDLVAARPALHGVIAAVGDGCWICVNEK